ncbi:MAG: radical SAM protein, partial [Nitrospirales bacterium]|nr:radical SAM protein [Nitrospirales bacterium]
AITRGRFRLNSVAYVMKMVDMLTEDLGYEGILFVDDILTINEERLSLLCKEMEKRALPWSALGRVDSMNENVLTMMKDSGCVQLTVGIESASADILKKMRKRITPKQQADAMVLAHKVGLPVKACFIVGFPGETDATIAETEEFIKRYVVALGFYGTLNTFVPLPGSDVFNNPSAYGIGIDADKSFDSYFIAGAAGIGGYFHRTNEKEVRKWVDLLRDALRGQLTYYRMQYRAQIPGASRMPQGDRR